MVSGLRCEVGILVKVTVRSFQAHDIFDETDLPAMAGQKINSEPLDKVFSLQGLEDPSSEEA